MTTDPRTSTNFIRKPIPARASIDRREDWCSLCTYDPAARYRGHAFGDKIVHSCRRHGVVNADFLLRLRER